MQSKVEIKKYFLHGIKYEIFILLFFLIPFYLNKQVELEFKTKPLPMLLCEERVTEIEPEEIKEIVRVPVSPPPVKQKKKEYSPPATLALPIISPIQVTTSTRGIDTIQIAEKIGKLDKQFHPIYKAKRFHIPSVEYKMEPKNLLIPAGMITIAAIASQTDKYRDFIPGIRKNAKEKLTPFDDIAQLTVSPSLFVFDIFAKEEHHPIDQFFLMAISYGITIVPVRAIKNNYSAERPYGGNHSFPSGHTATAFVGAHMIYKEFKNTNPWIAYSGYAMASVVAGARVVNHKHWVCDVVAGAGIAILSTELAYIIYFPARNLLTNEINKLVDKYILLVPVVQPEVLGFNLTVKF